MFNIQLTEKENNDHGDTNIILEKAINSHKENYSKCIGKLSFETYINNVKITEYAKI